MFRLQLLISESRQRCEVKKTLWSEVRNASQEFYFLRIVVKFQRRASREIGVGGGESDGRKYFIEGELGGSYIVQLIAMAYG